jgi:hypothetical protein
MENTLTLQTKQPAILRNLFDSPSVNTANAQKRHNKAAKSLMHIGVAIVLSNFSLEYMSGEDLLNYIKGTVLATLIVLASFTTEIKIASRVEEGIKSANPLGFVKKINHLFKGDEQHAA